MMRALLTSLVVLACISPFSAENKANTAVNNSPARHRRKPAGLRAANLLHQ